MQNTSPKVLTKGEVSLIYIKSFIHITNVLKRMQNCRYDEFKNNIYQPWAKHSVPGIKELYSQPLQYAQDVANNKIQNIYLDPNHKDGDAKLKKILFYANSYQSTAKEIEEVYYYDGYSKAFPISKEQVDQNNKDTICAQVDYIKKITGISDPKIAKAILADVMQLIKLEPTIHMLKGMFMFNEPLDSPSPFAEEYRAKIAEYNNLFKQIADRIDDSTPTSNLTL